VAAGEYDRLAWALPFKVTASATVAPLAVTEYAPVMTPAEMLPSTADAVSLIE
jgi:hypothetical protein